MTRIVLSEFSPRVPRRLASIDRVERLLGDPLPPAAEVAACADSAAKELHLLLKDADSLHFDRQRMDHIRATALDHPAKDWDEACGRYLLLQGTCSNDPRFQAPLAAIRELLQFRDEPQGNGQPIQYNSPNGFDPEQFNGKLRELRAFVPRQ